MSDTGNPPQDSAKARADALALAEEAEAEAAEAEALAAAARARARAIKLRREAQAQADAEAEDSTTVTEAADDGAEAPEPTGAADDVEAPDEDEPTESAEETDDAEPAAESTQPESTQRARRWLTVSSVLTAAAIVAICALLGTSGWMAWRHHEVVKQRQDAAAFVATAKQGIVNLTSLDFHKSKEDVQRILDSGTGEFKDQFQKTADDFAAVVKDTNAVAEGSVTAAAVESRSTDSAVVLVLSNERITNSAGAKDQPRTFRFRVSVVREGDQLKLSKVEFVL